MRITNELKRNNQTPHPTMTARKVLDLDRIIYATDSGSLNKSVIKTLFSMLGKGLKHVTKKGFELAQNIAEKKPAKLNNDDLQLF